MISCIYQGRVVHRRFTPVAHQFRYGVFMVYLDLQELPRLTASGGLLAPSWRRPVSFDPRVHLHGGDGSLRGRVQALVQQETGRRVDGPVRLLTQLTICGYYFSPLNLYYCFSADGQDLETIVAEVNNTPWGEQHCYVLWDGNRAGGPGPWHRYRHAKSFHVSPFMDMDMDYQWCLSAPGANVLVRIRNLHSDARLFEATMSLARRPLEGGVLRQMLWRYPLMTARIVQAIYWQALRLWWKRCPSYPHPAKRDAAGGS